MGEREEEEEARTQLMMLERAGVQQQGEDGYTVLGRLASVRGVDVGKV